MKYFNPSYWFKLWMLIMPIFNNKTDGVNILQKNNKKEIKLYYDSNEKTNKIIHFAPYNSIITNKYLYTFSIEDNIPTKYNKFEFLGDTFSNGWGTRVQWGYWIYDANHNTQYTNSSDLYSFMSERDNNLTRDILYNEKVNLNTIDKYLSGKLQNVEHKYWGAWMGGSQSFGLSWYEENYKYFFQVYFNQYLDWRASESSLDCWMKIGKGIRLYNDDNNKFKNQISNFSKKNKRNIVSNETKWTDEFKNSINHEQHLAIDNKTNFSTNNITSL